jgi:hypothetical protein
MTLVVLFAAAIEKSATLYGEKAIERATEEILSRFDMYLSRRSDMQDAQRGLIIFSEGRFDKRAKIWVRGFRELGTRWGVLRNLSDIPYFASVKETRLLQLADFVAHAVFMMYERRDTGLIRKFLHRFDQKDGVLHGLRHYRSEINTPCECPACKSRAKPYDFGAWV